MSKDQERHEGLEYLRHIRDESRAEDDRKYEESKKDG